MPDLAASLTCRPAMAPMPPRARDDRGLHPLLASGFLVGVVILATATAFAWSSVFTHEAEEPPRAVAEASTLTVEDQGGWIELLLTDAEPEAIAAREIAVTATGPHGDTRSTVCHTPRLVEEGGPCQAPVQEGSEWSRGRALWVPCQGEGTHALTLSVHGTGFLDTEAECGLPALAP